MTTPAKNDGDHAEDEAEGPSGDHLTLGLDPNVMNRPANLDDEEASDLPVAVELAEFSTLEDDDADCSHLDTTELIQPPPEGIGEDDDVGANVDLAGLIQQGPDEDPGAETEDSDAVIALDLPGLPSMGSEAGDTESTVDAFWSFDVPSEESIGDAAPPWQRDRISELSTEAVLTTPGGALSVGAEVLFLPDMARHVLGTTVHTAAPLGIEQGLVLLAGLSGGLWIFDPATGHRETCSEWATDLNAQRGLRISRLIPGTRSNPSPLALTSALSLLRWRQDGRRFEPYDAPSRVLAAASDDDRVYLVVSEGTGLQLWSQREEDSEWNANSLPQGYAEANFQRGSQLSVLGEYIALSDPGLGVSVSVDAGRSFRKIPGSAGSTAVVLGTTEKGVQVFASVFRSLGSVNDIVQADPGTLEAVRIAQLDTSQLSSDATPEVRTLLWDARQRVLYAGGGFGLLGVRPG